MKNIIPLFSDLPSPTPKATVEDVFDDWRRILNKPRARLDEQRAKVIRRALKLYSREDLQLAFYGASLDDWTQGANDRDRKFDGLHVILRDADKIEMFIEIAERAVEMLKKREQQSRPVQPSGPTDADRAAYTAFLERAQQMGIRVKSR